MKKEVEIPEGCEARIEGNKVVFVPKESDDERIRKMLISLVKHHADILEQQYEKDMLAYLEKQKDEAQRQFNLGVQAGKEEAMYEMEKEHKPLSTEETELNSIAFLEQLGYTCVPPGAEQKHIEGVIKNITKNKEAATKFLKSAGIIDDNGELAEMYRSEQKPAEWSEEDEHCIHQLILFCENCMQQDSEAIKCSTWLKSLRPQPHWKPSEEQMDALETAVSTLQSTALESLYSDLKNL